MTIGHGQNDAVHRLRNGCDIGITRTIHHLSVFWINRNDSAGIAEISQVTDDPVSTRLTIERGGGTLRRADDRHGHGVHERREIAPNGRVTLSLIGYQG